ncbi:hypothetical protein HYT04_00930 [Candidatus Kaiserbacteria bacterium]|nr:hypothetical protein [Candidatus Kaiserbacteria bacterium]
MGLSQRVEGIVVKGWKIASGLATENPFGGSTIKMQIQLFKELGLDLSGCYPGTLNVSIAPRTRTILVREPNYCGLKWHPDLTEDFFIFKCRLCFRGVCYDGWVYHPDKSKGARHQHKQDTFEILAPLIPGITYRDTVVLILDPNEIRIE